MSLLNIFTYKKVLNPKRIILSFSLLLAESYITSFKRGLFGKSAYCLGNRFIIRI